MNTKNIIFRGQARTIEDVVETWKGDHEEAMEVRDVEDVAKLCLGLGQFLKDWHQEAWQTVFAGKMKNPQMVGDLLRKANQRTSELFELIQQRIETAQAKGFEVDRAGDFAKATHEVHRIKDAFTKRWPMFDANEIKLARAEFAQGKYQTAEDLLSELQGSNP